MAALDFPASPTIGQTYTLNNITYRWDGVSWNTYNPTDLSNTTGTLGLAKGGTNAALTAVNGGIVYSNGTALAISTAGNSGQALVSAGIAPPTWTTLTLENLPGAWVKKAADVATTAALTLNTAQTSIDGVTLTVYMRVLVKNQATASQNGIYTGLTTTTWVRTADADTAAEIAGATVSIDSGTINSGKIFKTSFKPGDTLGTTAMNWALLVDTSSANSTAVTIAMNGTQAAGVSDLYARADHVHPSDTTRSPLAGSTSLTTTGTVTTGTWSASFGAVSGANLTSLTAGNLSGTIPSAVLGNSTHYIGTTAIALNRASAAQALTGITSIDGYAADIAGGVANQILYQTGANATSYIAAPTVTGTYLQWNGTAFVWATVSSTATVSSVAVSGGTTGLTTSGGPITTSGTITFAGTLVVANGGTGSTTAAGAATNLGLGTASNVQHNSLGIGTAASAVAGEIRATNNITAYYTSDRRFKENIKPINRALDAVESIGGKLFDWTDEYINQRGGEDGYFVRKADFGVIAQDVQAAFPLAVREKPDGTLAVDYEKLSALAFAAIIELRAEIKELKKV